MRDSCPYPRPDATNARSMEALLYFIWEREVIRIVKEGGGDKPYSDDPILSKYKFTNIRRKDDRVSKWINDNILSRVQHRHDAWFVLLITRLINWPPTLQRLIDEGILFADAGDFNPQRFSNCIEEFKAEGGKVYSGAYMVYPTKMDPGGVKSLALARHIIEPTLKVADDIDYALWSGVASIERFVTELSKCFGISTFMAGQVAADMTYLDGPLCDAVDLRTFAPIGPGSSRGLNYLYERAPNASWTQAVFNEKLMGINNRVISDLEITDLTLHDVQNCMCEFSKYCRTVLGEGKPKTIYQPEQEF